MTLQPVFQEWLLGSLRWDGYHESSSHNELLLIIPWNLGQVWSTLHWLDAVQIFIFIDDILPMPLLVLLSPSSSASSATTTHHNLELRNTAISLCPMCPMMSSPPLANNLVVDVSLTSGIVCIPIYSIFFPPAAFISLHWLLTTSVDLFFILHSDPPVYILFQQTL